MPPKGTKTAAAGPSKRMRSTLVDPAIKPTFVSPAASNRYKQAIVKRKCIPERGIVDPMRTVQRAITLRHWEEFVKSPPAAVVPVVREFYANVPEHRGKRALVRGKWVPFDGATINRFYQLPDILQCEFSRMIEDGVDYDDVLVALTSSGTEWIMSKGEIKGFDKSGLHNPGKVWHYFICAKLMPASHVSTVSRDRALLNYAIQQGYSIDVGQLIETSILHMARMSTSKGGFGHSSLIYALCLQAGVPTSASEEVLQPKPILSPDLVRSFKGEGSKKTAGPSTIPVRRSSQSTRPQPVADPSEMSSLLTKFTKRVDRMAVRHDQQYQHMMQCYLALAKEVPTRSGNPLQLPPAPAFSPYPPADTDDEDDTGDDDEGAAESEGDDDEGAADTEDDNDDDEASADETASTGDSAEGSDEAESD